MALAVARGLISAMDELSSDIVSPMTRILDNEKRTALHWAAKAGRVVSAVYLIEHGIDIEAKNKVPNFGCCVLLIDSSINSHPFLS